MADSINVQVVYAKPDRQDVIALSLPAGASVRQAIEASGLLARHADIDLAKAKVGIFGKLSKPDATLRDRDRVTRVGRDDAGRQLDARGLAPGQGEHSDGVEAEDVGHPHQVEPGGFGLLDLLDYFADGAFGASATTDPYTDSH